MTTLIDALKAKYKTPQAALAALGLDEALLKGKQPRMGAVARVLRDEVKKRTGIAQDADLSDLLALLDALKKSEEGNIEEIDAALSEAKEDEEGGEEKSEESPAAKQNRVDEFEEDPTPAKEDKMAGLATAPNSAVPALAEKNTEEKADDAEVEGGAPGEVAGDDPASKLHALLSGKLSPEELQQVAAILAERAGPEEKAPGIDEEPEDMKAEDNECEGNPKMEKGGTTPPAIDKAAMDAAISVAVKAERTAQKAIRDAERAVRPYVGELAMSFDSAAGVYRHALASLGVEGADKVHESALPVLLKQIPVPGSESRVRETRIAQDAASVKSFAEMFPAAARISA